MSIDIVPTTILAPFEAEHQAVSLTRNSGGGAFDPKVDLEDFAENQWRYNYNRDTGIFEGRYIEDEATRLNTKFSAPTTNEDVTISNTEHTISFYGSGTITLSGTHSETINGTDSVTRTEFQFTPTAGTLTISPNGDIEFLQLEEGSATTSPIPGDGSQEQRNADMATVTDLDAINFNPQEGTLVVEAQTNNADSDVTNRNEIFELYEDDQNAWGVSFETQNDEIITRGLEGGSGIGGFVLSNNSPAKQFHRIVISYSSSGLRASVDGSSVASSPRDITTLNFNKINIGRTERDALYLDGFKNTFQYYPRQLTDAQHQQESTL